MERGGGALSQPVDTTNFRVIEEQWGDYVLPDGIRVRVRWMLAYFWENEGQGAQIRTNTALSVLSPEDLRGEPNQEGERETVAEYEAGELEVRAETMGLYLLQDGQLILTRYFPRAVRRTNHFDRNGDPIIEVDAVTEIAGLGPVLYKEPLTLTSAEGDVKAAS